MERDITVELVWLGVRYARTVRSEVDTPLNRFMDEVVAAAQELENDIYSGAIKD